MPGWVTPEQVYADRRRFLIQEPDGRLMSFAYLPCGVISEAGA
jgi:hypothetical protein